MYKALESFTTKNYDVRRGQILAGDFTTQDEITEFLNIGYIVEYDGSLEITENGTYDVKDYEQAVVDVSGGGGNNNVYVDTSITTYNYVGGLRSLITSIDNIDTSSLTNFNAMFQGCNNLVTIPSLDLSNCTNMKSCFASCDKLENLPAFNIPKVTNMQNCFQYTENLSNDSINNILATCITATSYTRTKSLSDLGLSSTKYPASMIEGLSNYQAFLNAGWTIGY